MYFSRTRHTHIRVGQLGGKTLQSTLSVLQTVPVVRCLSTGKKEVWKISRGFCPQADILMHNYAYRMHNYAFLIVHNYAFGMHNYARMNMHNYALFIVHNYACFMHNYA